MKKVAILSSAHCIDIPKNAITIEEYLNNTEKYSATKFLKNYVEVPIEEPMVFTHTDKKATIDFIRKLYFDITAVRKRMFKNKVFLLSDLAKIEQVDYHLVVFNGLDDFVSSFDTSRNKETKKYNNPKDAKELQNIKKTLKEVIRFGEHTGYYVEFGKSSEFVKLNKMPKPKK